MNLNKFWYSSNVKPSTAQKRLDSYWNIIMRHVITIIYYFFLYARYRYKTSWRDLDEEVIIFEIIYSKFFVILLDH